MYFVEVTTFLDSVGNVNKSGKSSCDFAYSIGLNNRLLQIQTYDCKS